MINAIFLVYFTESYSNITKECVGVCFRMGFVASKSGKGGRDLKKVK